MKHLEKILSIIAILGCCLALAWGCDDEGSTEEVVVHSSGEALGATAEIPPEAETTQICASAVGLSLAQTLEVEEVSDLLGDTADEPAQKGPACYTSSREGNTITVDFSGCDTEEGEIIVTSVERGVVDVLFTDGFATNGIDVDGTLHLTRAEVRPLTYTVSTDDAPLNIEDIEYGDAGEVELDATLIIDRRDNYATLEGQGSVVSAGDSRSRAHRFFLGWHDLDQSSSEAAQPFRYQLPLDDCRCAWSGRAGIETNLELDSVTIDLDDFVDSGNDRFEDIEFTLTDVSLEGDLWLDLTGMETARCGDFEGCFNASVEATVDLDKDNIRTRVTAWCAEQGTDCGTLLALVERLPSSIEIDVERELCTAAEQRLRDRFPRGFCGRR